jgi:hypothetical protein
MGHAVKAVGAKQQVEFAQGLDSVGEKRFDGTSRLAARGARVVRRSALGDEMSTRTIIEKSCGALYQKTAPISARLNGPSLGEKGVRAPGWKLVKSPQPAAGALQVLG